MPKKMQCPCCGYYTIDESFDICPVCFWEDDRLQSSEPNVDGGANRPSLILGRMNYRQYGTSTKSEEKYCRAPLEEEKESQSAIDHPEGKRMYSICVRKRIVGL